MSVVLWPRQEILQLVIPQLANSGRVLTQKLIEEIIIKLSKLQNLDGKISLNHWVSVSQDLLRWNDSSIYLFWDMLTLAVYYLTPEKYATTKREEVQIEIECLAVFLVLHLPEPNNPSKQNTITSTFDSVWPLNADGEVYPTSPVSSPLSPSKDGSNRSSFKSPIGSPLSPRSPRNSANLSQVNTSSPKRSVTITARTPRGSTQHLHSVRLKIPLILSALNPNLSEARSIDVSDDFGNNIEAFIVTRRMVDAFGMMLSGGHSREQTVSPLSSLHPLWAFEHDSLRSSQDFSDSISGQAVTSQDLVSWINLHLSMNDLIYPVSMHSINTTLNPAVSTPSVTAPNPLDLEGAAKDGKSHNPQKVMASISTLSRFSPTVINSTSTTMIHVVTLGPSRSSSFRRMNRSYSDSLGSTNPADTFNPGNPDLLKLSFTNRTALSVSLPHPHSMDYDSEMESSSVHEFGLSTDINELTDGNTASQRSITNTNVGSPVSPQAKILFSPGKTADHKEAKFDLSTELVNIEGPMSSNLNNPAVSDSLISSHSSTTANTPANFAQQHHSGFSTQKSKELNAGLDNFAGFGATAGGGSGGGFKPEVSLPQLFLNYSQSSKFYFISPYYSATITGCKKCDVVIGAVFGAVIISGCESVRLSVTCRKLIVLNCVDCEFFLATLSPTIFSGDCRNNSIGPINTTYRNYRHHLKLTELKILIRSNPATASNTASVENGSNSGEGSGLLFDQGVNQWARLCDVNSCIETSGKFFSGSTNGTGFPPGSPTLSPTKPVSKKIIHDNLPVPSPVIAKLMPTEKYRVVSIPIKSEFISFEFSPIAIPAEYSEALKLKQDTVENIKSQVHQYLETEHRLQQQEYEDDMKEENDRDGDDLTAKLLASSTISKRFMEWLVASDNAQEVLDLIRIDSDKNANIHQ